MGDKIQHEGIVDSIDDRGIHVRIVQSSACAACKVANTCHASEQKVKVVDVPGPIEGVSVGNRVIVSASRQTAMRALLYGFGLPLVVLVGTLVAVLAVTSNEGLAALCGLGALVPYYFVVWLFRHRISRKVSFAIENQII
jgi:sigma-E factor negative regulatory protein RseC